MYVGSQSKWPHNQKRLKRLQYLLLVEVCFVDTSCSWGQNSEDHFEQAQHTAFTAPKNLETGRGNAAQTLHWLSGFSTHSKRRIKCLWRAVGMHWDVIPSWMMSREPSCLMMALCSTHELSCRKPLWRNRGVPGWAKLTAECSPLSWVRPAYFDNKKRIQAFVLWERISVLQGLIRLQWFECAPPGARKGHFILKI